MQSMGRPRYLHEVYAQRVPDPDMSALLTYDAATERYFDAFVAAGWPADKKAINHHLRNLGKNGVLRRWDVANRVRVAPEDIEVYLRIAGQPRPIE